MKKYGAHNFEWEVLEECESHQELDEMEFHYIKQFRSHVDENGYNLTFGGYGCSGYKLTKDQRMKISNSNVGVKKTEYHKKKISSIKKLQWSDKESVYNSEDFRRKLSNSHKEHKNGMYGRNHSQRAKDKMRFKAMQRAGDKHPLFGKKGKNNPNFNRSNSKKL